MALALASEEQFMHANRQYVVRNGEDYEACLAAPDQFLEWSEI